MARKSIEFRKNWKGWQIIAILVGFYWTRSKGWWFSNLIRLIVLTVHRWLRSCLKAKYMKIVKISFIGPSLRNCLEVMRCSNSYENSLSTMWRKKSSMDMGWI